MKMKGQPFLINQELKHKCASNDNQQNEKN